VVAARRQKELDNLVDLIKTEGGKRHRKTPSVAVDMYWSLIARFGSYENVAQCTKTAKLSRPAVCQFDDGRGLGGIHAGTRAATQRSDV